MYSQPWPKGIAIKIPISIIKDWVESGFVVYEADKTTKKIKNIITNANCSCYSVAYTDFEIAERRDILSVKCDSKVKNIYREEALNPAMFGYIKDSAWEYENEFRIRVDTDYHYDAVAIDIPDEVIDSFEIITGPRFKDNLLADLRKEVDIGFSDRRIIPSYYTGRLRWVYCDTCKDKK